MEKMLNYRKANINDVDKLVELRNRQLVDEGASPVDNIDKELEQYFTSSIREETLVVWIATKCDNIIATSGVCFFQYPPNFSNTTGKVAYITNVYTQEEYRKQGIATKLLEFIMNEIKKRDYRFVRLHASSQGKKLYKQLGFIDAEGFMTKML